MESGFPKILTASGAVANIIASDVHACAAIIHVLDMVLLPSGIAPDLAAASVVAPVQAAPTVPPTVVPPTLPRAGMAPATAVAAGR